jgi:hypothetical protein
MILHFQREAEICQIIEISYLEFQRKSYKYFDSTNNRVYSILKWTIASHFLYIDIILLLDHDINHIKHS